MRLPASTNAGANRASAGVTRSGSSPARDRVNQGEEGTDKYQQQEAVECGAAVEGGPREAVSRGTEPQDDPDPTEPSEPEPDERGVGPDRLGGTQAGERVGGLPVHALDERARGTERSGGRDQQEEKAEGTDQAEDGGGGEPASTFRRAPKANR